MRNNDISIKRGRICADPGNPLHKVFSPELMEDGTIRLVQSGVENTDDIIQSYYESTTLESILSRFAAGDTSALNRYEPIYADLTQQPKTLAEALQTVINSRNAFDVLPVQVKQQFDNDYNKWLATAGTEKWYEVMKPVLGQNAAAAPAAAAAAAADVAPAADVASPA